MRSMSAAHVWGEEKKTRNTAEIHDRKPIRSLHKGEFESNLKYDDERAAILLAHNQRKDRGRCCISIFPNHKLVGIGSGDAHSKVLSCSSVSFEIININCIILASTLHCGASNLERKKTSREERKAGSIVRSEAMKCSRDLNARTKRKPHPNPH